MALTEDQKNALVLYASNKWKGTFCRQCLANQWNITGIINLPLSGEVGVLEIGGPTLPLAAMTCQNCGNTLLINLIRAGIVGREGKAG